jgi:hypothetical protein
MRFYAGLDHGGLPGQLFHTTHFGNSVVQRV